MVAASTLRHLLSNAWCLLPVCVAPAASQAGAKWCGQVCLAMELTLPITLQPTPCAGKHRGGCRQQELTVHVP